MRKKGILVALVLIISFGMFFITKNIQSKMYSQSDEIKTETKVEETKSSENKIENTSQSIDTNSTQNANTDAKANTSSENTNSNVNQSITKGTTKDTNTSINSQPKQSTTPPQPPASTAQSPKPEQKTNFFILDTVNNKTIATSAETYGEVTVGDITKKILDGKGIAYRVTPEGYFSMIGGLKERANGPQSGWCFYVNGKKASIGAGSYVPKKEDTIEWKYLKDGISN